jgi:hypothetical protein
MRNSSLLTRLVASSALAFAVIFSAGCTTPGGSPNAGTRIRGELNTILEYPFPDVARAAGQAITDLQFVKTSEKKDALVAILQAQTAADKHVKVIVTKVTERTTRLQVQVGAFGDETVSQSILARVRAAL